jgi:hypothetical protein
VSYELYRNEPTTARPEELRREMFIPVVAEADARQGGYVIAEDERHDDDAERVAHRRGDSRVEEWQA